MAEQDSQRSSFLTSLPGILTGTAALITAISGLAIWYSNSSRAQPAPGPAAAPVVERTGQRVERPIERKDPPREAPIAGPAVPVGSERWCAEKYRAWEKEKNGTGVDDAALRKEIVQAHCNQFGFKVGKIGAPQ
ncbi:MAG TPA: hypothetical protein VL240_00530 [Candidatus Binatia bacterium]|nr:hypothetical protein [Candidatus Binatia bacterium]